MNQSIMNITELRHKLDFESDNLRWQELEKHFARGVVRVISTELDLISIALDISQNKIDSISTALANNSIFEPNISQAKKWQRLNSKFLCVVVAPFVLIQESDSKSSEIENTDKT